jgi:glycosyltransferase involved in cell wall biosynthesis
MKILFLLTSDLESPAMGGRYFPLARGLVRLGHQVTIATLHSRFQSLEQTRFSLDNVNIAYVGQMHVRKIGDSKEYFSNYDLIRIASRATWALSKYALRSQADIIQIGKPHPMNSLAGFLCKVIRNSCIFLDYDDYEAESNLFRSKWQRRAVTFFEDTTPRWVDHITTHNSFLKDRLVRLGIKPNKISFISNGVDRDRFLPPAEQEISLLRSKFNLEGKKVIAFIGSLSLPSHPIYLLLEAFVRVHQTLSQSVLLMVGGGEDFEKIQGKCTEMGLSGSVVFTGRIPSKWISVYYCLADVLVDPVEDNLAARGRLPLKLFESWASGVPFVSGDIGDRREVLGLPPAGLLAMPGDAGSLAECLINVLTDPGLASELRERGLARAKGFDFDDLAARLVVCYEDILRQKPGILN